MESNTKEKIERAMEMLEDGEHPKVVSQSTGIDETFIRDKILPSMAGKEDSRFHKMISKSLSVTQRMTQKIEDSVSYLDEGDVEGFFNEVSPMAAMMLAKDAVSATDPKIKQAAYRDLLDRSGHKAKQTIEINQKFDMMNRDEMIALVASSLKRNPEVVKQLVSAEVIESEVEEVGEVDG